MPKARVTKVIDGDTFKIPRKVIRLANVYAPEMGTKGGSQAKADLKNIVKGKNYRNLNKNQQTAGKRVNFMLLVKFKSLPRLFFLVCSAGLDLIELGSQNIHFGLAFDGFLG